MQVDASERGDEPVGAGSARGRGRRDAPGFRRRVWAAGVLLAGGLGALLLLVTGPGSEPVAPTDPRRSVRVVTVAPETVQLRVHSQGTVAPRVQSELTPEISGRIVWVSPELVAGGYFRDGDPLLRIDSADYESAVRSARARVIRAEADYSFAGHELTRRENLATSEVLSEGQLEDAQRAERVSFAELEAARAALEEAERRLLRTELRAPFVGRVRDKRVDVGQFVERGRPVATLYAIDYAEVRLPVPDREFAYLDWPSPRNAATAAGGGQEVVLSATLGGTPQRWRGRIVRTEGEIDAATRMIHMVARVEDPYGLADDEERAPLAVGLFVKAEILGRMERDVSVLPRAALQPGSRVYVVDADNHMYARSVEVGRVEGERVVIRAGLRPGEQVCVSDVPLFVDGMRVRPVPARPEPGA